MAIDCKPQDIWKPAYSCKQNFDERVFFEFENYSPKRFTPPVKKEIKKHPTKPAVSHPENDGFAVVMSRLCELPYSEEDEDSTRPTEFSFKLACAILNETNTILQSEFPRASFSTSETGGVRIYWRKSDFLIQLILPHNEGEKGYLQVLRHQVPNITYDISGQSLAVILNEFNEQK